MYTAVSVVVCVLLVFLAVTHALFASRRWATARLTLSALCAVAGFAFALWGRLRFGSLEMYNEWAADAFASFSKPLELAGIAALAVLAASVLMSRSKLKTVICLAAAAGFALFVVLYTAMFALMAESPSSTVSFYIRVCGAGLAATFAAVDTAAEIRMIIRKRMREETF